ncbi:helix-turn-helix domain-containing protein [Oerskovia enterophila]
MRKKREELGWSQQELAEALRDAGVSSHQTTVAKVERGERPLKMTEAVAVAYALGMVKLDEVLGETPHRCRLCLCTASA